MLVKIHLRYHFTWRESIHNICLSNFHNLTFCFWTVFFLFILDLATHKINTHKTELGFLTIPLTQNKLFFLPMHKGPLQDSFPIPEFSDRIKEPKSCFDPLIYDWLFKLFQTISTRRGPLFETKNKRSMGHIAHPRYIFNIKQIEGSCDYTIRLIKQETHRPHRSFEKYFLGINKMKQKLRLYMYKQIV